MKDACIEFRTLLERELARSGVLPTSADLTSLSWHEHLLGCEDCRELLRAEEALEELLSSLPQPALPPHLALRVLQRLRSARRELGLDDLLELDEELASPSGLSDRILAGLVTERGGDDTDRKLDRLLDRNIVEAPAGLAGRVLSGLESERTAPSGHTLDELLETQEVQVPVGLAGRILSRLEPHRAPAPIPFFERRVVRVVTALAAGVVAFVGAYVTTLPDPKPLNGDGTSVAIADPELLEDYYVLDNWGLLMAEDVDVLLATSMDVADEAVLELEEGE